MQTTTDLLPHQALAVAKLLPTRIGALFMDMGTGKALPLDTQILTPSGWERMENLRVGDRVIGANGKATEILGVFPQGKQVVYKITFSDGATAECTLDHLWKVITPLQKSRGKASHILPLSQIIAHGIKHKNGNRKFQIPLVQPVEFLPLKENLPIHPYVLGALVGDGHLGPKSVSFYTSDDEMIQLINERIPETNKIGFKKGYRYYIIGNAYKKNDLLTSLRQLNLTGKRAEAKFIPHCYLYASIEERIHLLQGLLDTNGSVDSAGIAFSTVSRQLAEDLKFLVQSLGGLVSTTIRYPSYRMKNGESKKCQPSYRLYIRFPNGIQAFRLTRKRVKIRTNYQPTRSIESIEEVGEKEAQCIAVRADDGLYVIQNFVVTHNTRTTLELARIRQEKWDRLFWFAPCSLKETIYYEILKHTDLTDADIALWGERVADDRLPLAAPIHIIGIESMSASNRTVLAYAAIVTEQSFIVVDESSYIKGHDSLRTMRITELSAKARYRLILTGTPFSNGVADLYAQMAFLSKKILGYTSFYSFAANHLEYEMRRDSFGTLRPTNHVIRAHNVEYLAAKIAPYIYQVRKGECLDLPDKLYETRYFRMTDEQRSAYEQAKDEILSLETDDWTSIAIFRLFTALQAIVCGFWTRTDPQTHRKERLTFNHLRIDALRDVIDAIPDGEKIIIWAKYQHAIQEIRAALQLRDGSAAVAEFHGAIPQHHRHQELRRWQQGDARYLIATQSTGGHGLTLNESAYAIFYADGYKYSERVQAEDRQHRLGQARQPTYISLCCAYSIDERIRSALERKENALRSFQQQLQRYRAEGMRERARKLIHDL
jgi:SNF2-related domain/Helicase conserved C-terminal domain/LAGLIDADG-like domain